MGWDVLVFKLIDPATPASQLDESKLLPLVEHAEIRPAIDAVLPGISWSEPEYGWVEIGASHLGFHLGQLPLCIAIWVHGGGDPVTPIVALCKANGWVAFDTTTADFIDLNLPSTKGWDAFRSFRDSALMRLATDVGGSKKDAGKPAQNPSAFSSCGSIRHSGAAGYARFVSQTLRREHG